MADNESGMVATGTGHTASSANPSASGYAQVNALEATHGASLGTTDEATDNKREASSMMPSWGVDTKSWGPGKKGTLACFFLLIIGIIASIIVMVQATNQSNGTDYTSNCPEGFETSCARNGAIMRFSFALCILFILQLLGTAIYTPYYDMLWIVKYIVWTGVLIGFFFTDAVVFDTDGYAWFARICGFLFVIFQQVILLDLAFTWNERWVSNDEDSENPGICGRLGLLVVSLLIFSISYAGLGVMFWQFGGPNCHDNNAILGMAIGLTSIATVFQLTVNESYSLLTSAFVTGYGTYIAYAAVTLNPKPSCNPTLASDYQTLSEIIGIVLTVLSLIWTTYTTSRSMILKFVIV
jgi:hypothetical protein